MVDLAQARAALISRVLEGSGHTPASERRSAFENLGLAEPQATLVGKVAHHAWRVTDDDISAMRTAGYSEDQIFEIVVCAAIGQANMQYENALAALEAATRTE